MTIMFSARTSDKSGRTRHQVFADSREKAAELVFNADPQAKLCSTAKAHLQSDGQYWNTGSAMIWHRRQGIRG